MAQKKNEEAQTPARQIAMDDLKSEKERITQEVTELKNKEAADQKVREENLRNQQAKEATDKLEAERLAKEQARLNALEKQKQEALAKEQLALAAKQEAETKTREENIRQQKAQEAAAKLVAEQKARAEAKAAAEKIQAVEEQAKIETSIKEEARQKAEAEAKAKAAQQAKVEEPKKQAPTTFSTDIASTEGKADYGTLPAVLFEKNEYLLSTAAKAELKLLAQKLLKVPQLTVNIYAFASQDESNSRQISLRRSDAVLRFFIDNGVPIEQVKSFYYGTTVSRNGCVNPNCPEGLQQQNRAVAYQIVMQ